MCAVRPSSLLACHDAHHHIMIGSACHDYHILACNGCHMHIITSSHHHIITMAACHTIACIHHGCMSNHHTITMAACHIITRHALIAHVFQTLRYMPTHTQYFICSLRDLPGPLTHRARASNEEPPPLFACTCDTCMLTHGAHAAHGNESCSCSMNACFSHVTRV